MNFPINKNDLVIIVADKNMEAAINGILSRNKSLGIRQISHTIFPHYHRDPGCRLESHRLLESSTPKFQYAIVMFDREGCGAENIPREELENNVEVNLASSGWKGRSIALVLDPELEVWVWKNSPHVATAMGWEGKNPDLYAWLKENGYINEGEKVPNHPKEAMEAALRVVHKPRSSSIYLQLAKNVGLKNCTNPAFIKLKKTLQEWFSDGDNKEDGCTNTNINQ